MVTSTTNEAKCRPELRTVGGGQGKLQEMAPPPAKDCMVWTETFISPRHTFFCVETLAHVIKVARKAVRDPLWWLAPLAAPAHRPIPSRASPLGPG